MYFNTPTPFVMTSQPVFVRGALRMLSLAAAILVLSFARPAEATVNVVATLPDLGALAAEVGGDLVRVHVIAQRNEDPHYVDPRPSHLVALSRADLLVTNGMSLESAWLSPLQVQARNRDIQTGAQGYFEGSACVHAMQTDRPLDRSGGDIHPGGNPHYLLDARAGAAVARCLAERLGQIDHANAAAYEANGARVADELLAFAAEQAVRFAALEHPAVVVYHDSLVYLLDGLGVEQLATIEPRPGVSPGPAQIAEVVSMMQATSTSVVLSEAYYPANVATRVATLAGGQFVSLESGTDFDGGQRYLEHLRVVVDAAFAALSGT